jgi:hypothetical protein
MSLETLTSSTMVANAFLKGVVSVYFVHAAAASA